ncbi:MAG TPA: hypothetical protein PKY59_25075 [Pyrinomonadaceae bacterium]|nr:hypothetical protein [Pyrinomonadaceae bacterium]
MAANTNKKVGLVTEIHGKMLTYTRKYSFGMATFVAYKGMPVNLGDIFETGQDTTAEIEFYIGGRATIDNATKIEIVSNRDAVVLDFDWRKVGQEFTKEASPVRIRTAGGVTGIRG